MIDSPTPQRSVPRAFLSVATAAAAIIVIAGMRELSWLIEPVVLALIIVILVHPVHRLLLRRGVPPILALASLLLAVYAVVLGLLAIIGYSLARLTKLIPSYLPAADTVRNQITTQLAQIGVSSPDIRELVNSINIAKAIGWLAGQLPTLASLGANVVFLFSLLLFLGIESSGVTQRASALITSRPRTGAALLDFVHKTRRYVAVTGLFAVLVGICDTLLLLVIGIPLAPLWGLLAAACNFIPYIGFIIGVVPPALLALLGGGWQQMVLVIVIYIVLNSLLTTLLPAKFVGSAVGMSMTVTMISVVFWSWVLGPMGSVLAVPLSLLAKGILVDADPRAAWLSGFIDSPDRPSGRRRLASTGDETHSLQ